MNNCQSVCYMQLNYFRSCIVIIHAWTSSGELYTQYTDLLQVRAEQQRTNQYFFCQVYKCCLVCLDIQFIDCVDI